MANRFRMTPPKPSKPVPSRTRLDGSGAWLVWFTIGAVTEKLRSPETGESPFAEMLAILIAKTVPSVNVMDGIAFHIIDVLKLLLFPSRLSVLVPVTVAVVDSGPVKVRRMLSASVPAPFFGSELVSFRVTSSENVSVEKLKFGADPVKFMRLVLGELRSVTVTVPVIVSA